MVGEGLPPLMLFHGDWEKYVEELYEIYLRELVHAGHAFDSLPISYRYNPPHREKGYGFWHCIQKGPNDTARYPDLRRCERLPWLSWILLNVEKDSRITWWEEKRGSEIDICIFLEDGTEPV